MIGKEFFLTADPNASDPIMGVNFVRMPIRMHELEHRIFAPGQGRLFHDFLLGELNTGDKPRTLPGPMAQKVARFVNAHRRANGRDGHETAYVVQLVGVGHRELRWSLERAVSLREGRFGLKPDQLRIRRWHRGLRYWLRVTAFDSEASMQAWEHAYHRRDLRFQQLVRRAQPDANLAEPNRWFTTMGWQKLPDEFVLELNAEGKNVVFPGVFTQLRQAVARAPVPMKYVPFFVAAVGYELVAEDDRHGPENHVFTEFKATIALDIATGVVR
jgi:hypothetical protein